MGMTAWYIPYYGLYHQLRKPPKGLQCVASGFTEAQGKVSQTRPKLHIPSTLHTLENYGMSDHIMWYYFKLSCVTCIHFMLHSGT